MKSNPTWQKTISWLIVSYVVIAATVWYESGNLYVAMTATLWACIIKTPVYSLHEALWGRLIFKKQQTTEIQVQQIEFHTTEKGRLIPSLITDE